MKTGFVYDPKFLEHEKDILRAQLADSGKPAKIVDQILEGKLQKLYSEICLLKQVYIKNDQFTIEQVLQDLIAKKHLKMLMATWKKQLNYCVKKVPLLQKNVLAKRRLKALFMPISTPVIKLVF